MAFKSLLRVLAASLALPLGGCFVSETPFFGPGEADYPLPDGAKYVEYQLHYHDGRAERVNPHANEIRLLTVARGAGDPDTAALAPGRYYNGSGDKRAPIGLFLLKHLDGAYYIVEAAVPKEQDPHVRRFMYLLMKIENGQIGLYPLACHPLDADSSFVESGALAVEPPHNPEMNFASTTPCLVKSFDDLRSVLRARIAENAQPQGVWVVQ